MKEMVKKRRVWNDMDQILDRVGNGYKVSILEF